jgi:hypothetical protein
MRAIECNHAFRTDYLVIILDVLPRERRTQKMV